MSDDVTILNQNNTIGASICSQVPVVAERQSFLPDPRLIGTLMLCILMVNFIACHSKAEGEPEKEATTHSAAAPDGSIRLTPEQIQANGLKTESVVEQEVAAKLATTGRVKARAGGEAQVFSPFAGRLMADPTQLPRFGSAVRRGAVIAEVEQMLTTAEQAQISASAAQFAAIAVQQQAAIEQAQREAAFRQTEFERLQRLYADGAIPLKQAQAAEFNLKQAQTQLEGARRSKAQSEAAQAQQANAPRRAPIVAPISGTVVAADLTVGQQLDVSKSLLTIVDLSSVWVEAPIHESDLPAARRARRAEIATPANPGRVYSGQLVSIGSLVDPVNRTINVIFVVSNVDGGLKLEMTADVRIPTQTRARALLIPASAVLYEEGQRFVYIEREQGVFQRRVVTLGGRQDEYAIITSGLQGGEKVVSVGAQSLRSETLKGQIQTDVDDDEKKEKR
ncbi:MAG: efflux RND transporter periplasmic adaptor subunit [Chloracidobacterium sp.]|nr:efflux RND transporter periplasmic adaptor subunit [Chloracidobacterium sp.]